MQIDSAAWSGDGPFTAIVLRALEAVDAIEVLRLEDAPASRAEPGYAFISNEIYVTFKTERVPKPRRRLGLSWPGTVAVKRMRLGELAGCLGRSEGVGEPDYADDGMLQYLRTERIVPPYQTRGYKVVEMVRIYEAGTPRRA